MYYQSRYAMERLREERRKKTTKPRKTCKMSINTCMKHRETEDRFLTSSKIAVHRK